MIRLKDLLTENKNRFEGGYGTDIEKDSVDNKNFRKVLYTTNQLQLVVMSIDTDIGEEVHRGTTQFIRVEEGEGVAIIDGKKYPMKAGDSIVVPSGCRHNVVNSGGSPLKVYSLYAPPKHPEGTIQKAKKDAEEHSNK